MVGGVLHGFQPQLCAEARACEQRAIADRRDIGIRCQQLLVDDNSGRHGQTSFRSQFDIGQDPDADHDQICRQMAAIAQADAGHVVAIALDAGGLDPEVLPVGPFDMLPGSGSNVAMVQPGGTR